MSVVVGLIDNGEIYMASDSAHGSLDLLWIRESDSPKVWRHGDFLFGAVGKTRVADIIQQKIKPTANVTACGLADMIRIALKESGSLKVKDGLESMEAEVLIGSRGMLYHVHANFGVTEHAKYHAIGAGALYALGALHVMSGENWVPSTKVSMAVEAAAAFSPYVCGRVQGLRLKTEEAA